MDRRFVWLAIAVALAGCTPPVVQPVVEVVAPTAAPSALAPVIANLKVPSTHTVGAEVFEVIYDVTVAGSGSFASYGLKTSQWTRPGRSPTTSRSR